MIVVIGGGGIAESIVEHSGAVLIDSKDIFQVGRILDTLTNISSVIITSGYLVKGDFSKSNFQDIEKTISANLVYPIEVTKIVLEKFPDIEHIVYFSSSVVFGTRQGYSVYASSKIALEKFAENLREENGKQIKIVRNGRTDTKLRWNNYEDNEENRKNVLTTEEVALATLDFLYKEGRVLDIFKEEDHLNIMIDRGKQ